MTNRDVAKLLRNVAAALTLKKASIFQIRAYETAADAIEHLTSEVKDLWEEGKLAEVPGVGKNLSEHLNELFSTGKVAHFESLTKDLPPVFFEALDIPGVGPKTAQRILSLKVQNLEELKQRLEDGSLIKEGFSEKLAENILLGLKDTNSEKDRMLLPFAEELAAKILDYLRKSPDVKQADCLGSLRRKVATIGDLDFAVASDNPEKAIKYFVKMPGISRIVDQGENKAMVMLTSHLQIDLLVGKPKNYGNLLQHFTGSKHHNISLRKLAEDKGYSISEYGVKKLKTAVIECKTEEEVYSLLDMQTPPSEIREDAGEIEAALKHQLPQLIPYGSLKGDLHLHSSYPIEPSHDLGRDSMEDMVKRALALGYKYLGFSDHSPATSNHSKPKIIDILKKRSAFIDKLKLKYAGKIEILAGLEADIQPDGSISVPDEGLKLLDYCIVGVHSAHRMEQSKMTARILKALSNPYVQILAHPTGRLLNQRPSFEADWAKVFEFCAKKGKILEINSFPDRLDLRDDLVRQAISKGVKLVIDSDAHGLEQMDQLDYGVAVARRGWATSADIINTYGFKDLLDVLK
ncbi:hypothetical protein A2631_02445 [Candidatus Daviesbacteria bacterium RIFCSPHIGHO2_01_FULL_44_29]|uniref:DNA-directed DNA polymerase n=1 Tax=Candidatus Daviesbacteria bacterium RIFCSPHIGHO2_02_FULL_43_12 TaxID=1797776 RepID=A0A1F5KKH3_9BACT|nr:MAG: hypothetical protein A2631_02445 [Candidatus Daviesbacteria bacterium RIFCSPHIGHO2_01_FULL_44_29]OGE40200.1 MAG: hypothetical protein A3E86_04460 [Candidatus Daviesbacteria bacterium RIFCSPHIGHO2_12_FULL_47_45]OGE41428.1 MAG: hypothetical protein A3D25_01840 [Candidatus Daviesbacteria bacterium RIFCSPHIGHO2_02_FULL_43_12]OGE69628.1 MAG: hypothetical protein A3B55_03580 [Candidatus Daviesbacteria bacterium RIFCSPLOWO2_01_FULL_43_15]